MSTFILDPDPMAPVTVPFESPHAIDRALQALDAHGLIVYPTETLYGLGGDPFRSDTALRIARVKGRPPAMPTSIALASIDELERYARVPPSAHALATVFLPGPMTLVLDGRETVPPAFRAANGTVGFRVPDHPFALELLDRFGLLTATSANRHGQRAPRTIGTALDQLGDAVALSIDAGPLPGTPSTIVEVTGGGGEVRVLRVGAIGVEELKKTLASEGLGTDGLHVPDQ